MFAGLRTITDPGEFMAIEKRQDAIVSELTSVSDWRERYRRIIELGREMPEFPDEHRTDKNKVKGCQSQVWLHAWLDDGNMRLAADSDAAIVRGLIAILLQVFDGEPPADVAQAPVTFIDRIGLSDNLSQTRSNGLSSMIKQIKMYAMVFDAMAKRA